MVKSVLSSLQLVSNWWIFWDYVNILFLIKLSLTTFSIHSWILMESAITLVAKWRLINYILFLFVGSLLSRNAFSYINILIDFVFILLCTSIIMIYSMGYNARLWLFILIFQKACSVGASSTCSYMSFNIPFYCWGLK